MKKTKILIMAVALLCASIITARAQNVDDVISKHLAATGGVDNWKKITSIKMNGSVNAQGMEFPVTITKVSGKGYRMEFSINGMVNYQIITPTGGWMFFPVSGQTKPEALPEESVKESQDELDVQGPLVDYKAKGNKITYLGKDDVEGTDCYKLKVTYPSGKDVTMYIDASTYYHIRSVEKVKANGQEQEMTVNYSNYQKLPEGIMFPMTIESANGPVAIKSVDVNKPVDDGLFKPTEVAAGSDTKK